MRYANNEKRETKMTEGKKLLNQAKKMIQEKETWKDLLILDADTIKQAEMKEKIKKGYRRRLRKLIEAKLKGINTWAVPIVRYSGPFLKWTREELRYTREKEN